LKLSSSTFFGLRPLIYSVPVSS
jgi:hypothetical protein